MSEEEQFNTTQSLRRSGVNRIIQVAAIYVVQSAVLFISAGTITWLRAWLFVGLNFVFMIINLIVLLKISPELINVRGEVKPGTKESDKIFSLFYGILIFSMPAVAGLDFRLGWSFIPLPWAVPGSILWIAGYVLLLWAMVVNIHFEVTVRIQEERGHKVCMTGPYQYVRHPGYVGMILMDIGPPLILGSLWMFVPVCALVILMVIRTAWEDRILRCELPGYTEYAGKVNHRLFPGVW